MLEDKGPGAGNPASDPVTIGSKLAGIEPVRRMRGDGALYESDTLGRLQFVQMPGSRPSFWHGILPMPDSPHGLKIVCEVEHDDPPGADHAACVVAIRRRQLKDAAASLPLIRARLQEMQRTEQISTDDLRLAGIQLPAKPMISARQVLEYRAAPVPRLLFMVVYLHGKVSVVHVDSDH